MKKYILAIDQGTTSTRAILINAKGEEVYKAQRPVDCLYPQPGWVEVDPDKIWISVIDVINELMVVSSSTLDDVAAIGLTNQRETTVIWDKKSGKAVANAIVWQSKQTQAICDAHGHPLSLKPFRPNKAIFSFRPAPVPARLRF